MTVTTPPPRPAKLPHPVFHWDACKLADLTMRQLIELTRAVESDPASANPGLATGSIWKYTPAARKKLDALARAVTFKLGDLKKARTPAGRSL